MTTALGDLIARLEAAKEGSRELDGDIALFLSLPPEGSFRPSVAQNDAGVFAVGAYTLWHSPKFTISLDAALTLVPEGYDYGFSFSKQHGLEAWVQKPFKQSECFQGYAPDGDMTNKTRAKAMSIAALKARGEP